MEYFRLDHPPDREDFACAAHTSSVRHASVLPKGLPSVEPTESDLLPSCALHRYG